MSETVAQFQFNAGTFNNVRPYGERLTDGYYTAKIANLLTTDRAGNFKIVFNVDGAEVFDWISQPGTIDAETSEKKKQREEGNARKIVSILTSQGYRAADIAAGAVNQNWFLNEKMPFVYIAYVSWTEPDVDGSSKMKSEITYLTKEAFDAKVASGKLPERYKKATAAGATPTAMPGAAFQVPGAAAGAVPGATPTPAFGAPPGAPAGVPGFGGTPPGFAQPQQAAVQGPPGFAGFPGAAAVPNGVPGAGMPPGVGGGVPGVGGGFARPPGA